MAAPGSYTYGVAITKSDANNFAQVSDRFTCDAIYVGGAGVVVVVFPDGSTQQFTCIAGQILPVAAVRVNSTNTTATLMIALYNV
jgi:hypothetical protein